MGNKNPDGDRKHAGCGESGSEVSALPWYHVARVIESADKAIAKDRPTDISWSLTPPFSWEIVISATYQGGNPAWAGSILMSVLSFSHIPLCLHFQSALTPYRPVCLVSHHIVSRIFLQDDEILFLLTRPKVEEWLYVLSRRHGSRERQNLIAVLTPTVHYIVAAVRRLKLPDVQIAMPIVRAKGWRRLDLSETASIREEKKEHVSALYPRKRRRLSVEERR